MFQNYEDLHQKTYCCQANSRSSVLYDRLPITTKYIVHSWFFIVFYLSAVNNEL